MMIPYLENVRISDLAVADLTEAWTYISVDSDIYADKTIDEIVLHFAMIGNFPLIGSLRDELIDGLRIFPYKNFNIYYIASDDGVEIYRVLHSSREQNLILEGTIDLGGMDDH